jgi:hypothetical protein
MPDEGMWDFAYTYDFAFSALIGAMVNDPKYEDSAFGPWEQATAAILCKQSLILSSACFAKYQVNHAAFCRRA